MFFEAMPGHHNPPAAIILALYNQHIKTYREVFNQVKPLLDAPYITEDNQVLMSLFHRWLRRYLNGVGHPNHPDVQSGALISAEAAS